MFLRIAAMALGLGLAGQAAAATNNAPPPLREICRQSTPVIRELWSKETYDAPPAVATLMVDAIDGKLPEVRLQLQAMKSADAQRWRQTAMITAAWTGQSAVVGGLLNDGAAVNGLGWIPPYKSAFFGQTVDAMKRDSRFGDPTTVKGMMATGMVSNRGQFMGPALMVVAECGDVATLDVLLQHHANVAQRVAPSVIDALAEATIDGDAPVVQRLLDHGAEPCADDRRIAQFHLMHPTRPTHTLAQIGTHAGLPATLITRLTCPAVAAAP